MTAPTFLVDPGLLTGVGPGAELLLDGAEGRHAATVRRLTAGERLDLADGAGTVAVCVVAAAHRDALTVRVESVAAEAAPSPRLTVVQALPKGDRGELAVETMTEVGADAIVPWSAARCVTQWRGERGAKSLTRWRRTAREAAKQARRRWVPSVAEPVSTRAVAELLAGADLAVVLHESATEPLAGLTPPTGGEIVVVVGPEGGITDAELATFVAAGARVCRLGPSVLRTSTAGVVAGAVLLAASGRWG